MLSSSTFFFKLFRYTAKCPSIRNILLKPSYSIIDPIDLDTEIFSFYNTLTIYLYSLYNKFYNFVNRVFQLTVVRIA